MLNVSWDEGLNRTTGDVVVCVSCSHSGVQLQRARPPFQLGDARAQSGGGIPREGARARARARPRHCQRQEEELRRLHEQPSPAAEEPDTPAQGGGERLPDVTLQAQFKKAVRGLIMSRCCLFPLP